MSVPYISNFQKIFRLASGGDPKYFGRDPIKVKSKIDQRSRPGLTNLLYKDYNIIYLFIAYMVGRARSAPGVKWLLE